MRKAVTKWLPDSRRGKMIPLGCNMYVVLKVQNGNGSHLVIVFLLYKRENNGILLIKRLVTKPEKC